MEEKNERKKAESTEKQIVDRLLVKKDKIFVDKDQEIDQLRREMRKNI